MISYEGVCKKLGFDPIVDDMQFPKSDHEDDRWESPFLKLTGDELDFLCDYLIANKDKLSKYMVK